MVGVGCFDLPRGVVDTAIEVVAVIVVAEGVFDVVPDALLELPELAVAAPDLTAELGQLARTEHHERHDEHHEDLERADLRQSNSFRADSRNDGTREGLERRLGPAMMRAPVRPITFAHRGARTEAPENTMPAFRRALELGASGLESDAWMSADGEVVLVHDRVARRGLRRRKVSKSSADALAELGVPRLADLYAELGSAFELSIDIKDRATAEPIVELARAAGDGAPGRLWLCHASVRFLSGLRERMPDVKLVHSRHRQHIEAPLERHAADLAASGVNTMNLHYSEWTAGLVVLFHRFAVNAFAWDVQEVRHLRAMLDFGIDAVYCDRVDRMVATVTEWSEPRREDV
jgi:glycerophosphoryl diester phosphodiesterase